MATTTETLVSVGFTHDKACIYSEPVPPATAELIAKDVADRGVIVGILPARELINAGVQKLFERAAADDVAIITIDGRHVSFVRTRKPLLLDYPACDDEFAPVVGGLPLLDREPIDLNAGGTADEPPDALYDEDVLDLGGPCGEVSPDTLLPRGDLDVLVWAGTVIFVGVALSVWLLVGDVLRRVL